MDFLNRQKATNNVINNQKETFSNEDLAFLALMNIADGVAILDAKCVIEMINPTGAQLLGYTSEIELVGLDFGLIFHLEDRNGVKIEASDNLVLRYIQANQKYHTRDYVLIPKDGAKKIFIDIDVIPAQNGKIVLTFRDITKEVEEENEKSDFISTASHEMRTPVASIEGYLGLALNPQTATLDERARKYLEEAHKASQHLGKLFQDLLDVTKLDDKKKKLKMVPVELGAELQNIVFPFNLAVQKKQMNLVFGGGNTTNRILRQPIYAMVDMDFLRETMFALLDNAIKFSKPGATITVKVAGEEDKCIITVSDTGSGIPSEDLKHIFQKFYRVDSRDIRESGGAGLGLYIAKQRVESMNGTIMAESMYGNGSTFTVRLPRISYEEYNKQKLITEKQEGMI